MEASTTTAANGNGVSSGRVVRVLYRLRADARLVSQPDGVIVLQHARFEAHMARPGVGCRAMLLRLAEQWADDADIGEVITSIQGERGIMAGQMLLRKLLALSWLRRRLQAGSRPLLDVIPLDLGPDTAPFPVRHDPQAGACLSRFAAVSAGGTGPASGTCAGHGVGAAGGAALTARTPLSAVEVAFPDGRVAGLLVPAASGGCTSADLARLAGLSQRAAGTVLDELLTARILVSAAERQAEIGEPPMAVWASHELSLHHRARSGRHSLPTGGTGRFRGQFAIESLHRTAPDDVALELPVPDLGKIRRTEPSLTEVITSRRSIRSHDEANPITEGQLAEFLYRVQHTSPVRWTDDGLEVGTRPYPSGGQLCELEIYPLVSRCTGLSAGLYRYDSIEHRLARLAPMHPAGQQMLAHARAAAMMAAPPQVLLVITTRVQRLLWKYEGMGYALSLKNSGVLTELMYLVATAMGLAPCALGSGDAAAFAQLSGLDPLVEPSLADFVLGSRSAAS